MASFYIYEWMVMSRTALAFLIAPLWVPAITAPYAVHMFPYPEQGHWIYITTIVGAVFAYGGALTLGLPAFLILRARKFTAFWIAPVVGFAIGVVTCIVCLVLFGLSLGGGLTFVSHDLATNFTKWWSVFCRRARWEQPSGRRFGCLLGQTAGVQPEDPSRPFSAPAV
jgi:hypothetical protein